MRYANPGIIMCDDSEVAMYLIHQVRDVLEAQFLRRREAAAVKQKWSIIDSNFHNPVDLFLEEGLMPFIRDAIVVAIIEFSQAFESGTTD